MNEEETVSNEEILELLVKAQEDEIKQLKRDNRQWKNEVLLLQNILQKKNEEIESIENKLKKLTSKLN